MSRAFRETDHPREYRGRFQNKRGSTAPRFFGKSKVEFHLSQRGGTEPKASLGVLRAGARILPQAVRARWVEEWRGELAALESRRGRIRFVRQMLWGIPRMALVLRWPEPDRPRG
jgi:hypothetical protein